jgi:hypothetical protein
VTVEVTLAVAVELPVLDGLTVIEPDTLGVTV